MGIMQDDFRTKILQGEILMLIHDLGKLDWRFLEGATSDHGTDLTSIHTIEYLGDLSVPKDKDNRRSEAVDRILNAEVPLPKWQETLRRQISWLAIGEQDRLTRLGSLIALHHLCMPRKREDAREFYFSHGDAGGKSLQLGKSWYHPGQLLSMLADTCDSHFSKGDGGDPIQNRKTLHLAFPLGGCEMPLSEEKVRQDASRLADRLCAWSEGIESWDSPKILSAKVRDLQAILRAIGSEHLAETRLPNNDVTLWQHSCSAAAIFKALLASCLIRDQWDQLVTENGDLTYSSQRLATLSIRWDTANFLSRSLRSNDIVGRMRALHSLTESLKRAVELELCLGNEIYRDHRGICFLIPDLKRNDAGTGEKEALKALNERILGVMDADDTVSGLRWKVLHEAHGMLLTGMLTSWGQHFDELKGDGPYPAHLWRAEWNKGGMGICPRCGLRPVSKDVSRRGSGEDRKCCHACEELRRAGSSVFEELGGSEKSDYAKSAFGDLKLSRIHNFARLLDQGEAAADGQGKKDNRLALVQGVIPLGPLYDGTLFDGMLRGPSDDYLCKKGIDWQALSRDVEKSLVKIAKGDLGSANELGAMRAIFGKRWGEVTDEKQGGIIPAGHEDGWCNDAEPGHYQRRWIENTVLSGDRIALDDPKRHAELAQRIIRFALRRHPSPSRMTRAWDEVRAFMRGAFALAQDLGIQFVPLSCDAGRFQILMSARHSLHFMQELAKRYEERFGQVRHLLPLHLSASIFYHKAPLYIAMDAARRFELMARERQDEKWELLSCEPTDHGEAYALTWRAQDGREVHWSVRARLPSGEYDAFHTWFNDDRGIPVPLKDLEPHRKYAVRPSTFDFEVLDASTRRYDIHALTGDGETTARRPHFMVPHAPGPRPYPLSELPQWQSSGTVAAVFASDKVTQSQRKIALELVSRLHNDWDPVKDRETFISMLRDILSNTLGLSGSKLDAMAQAALDGTFFDLYEWYDFIGVSTTGGN